VSAERIEEELQALARLPAGRAKAQRLESLAEEAKDTGAHHLEAQVLVELSRAYEYGAEREKLPLALGRLLRLADQYPSEIGGGLAHTIYWQLKWMTSGMIHNPAVPLETVNRWMGEFESRYRQRGYSPRPVHADRADLALLLGDDVTASAAMAASIAAPRDRMSDCQACEHRAQGRWRIHVGDDAGALEHWAPVLNGSLRCKEEPHSVLSQALLPLLRTGRSDEARGAFLRGYPMVKGNVSLMSSVGRHAEFCALTGNEARGLEILAEHTGWLTDTQVDVSRRLDFIEGVTVLLRRLSVLGHGELPLGTHTVASLLASHEEEIHELCARYEKRNGTSAVGDRVAARLARQPLVDHLPLGLPNRLPALSTPVVAATGVAATGVGSAAPGETLERLIERAERALRDGDPLAAEGYARDALTHGVASDQRQTAMVASLLVEALGRQPDKALELAGAALFAAARWDGISDPDTLHNTFNAARAYAKLNRHAEAAALFAEAMSRVSVPYEPAVVAATRDQYGRSLRAIGRHAEAAEQFLEAARIVADDPAKIPAQAGLAAAAAESLQRSGQREAALPAFRRAAALFWQLGNVVTRIRCLRSAAWIEFSSDVTAGTEGAGVAAMRSVLAELEPLITADAPAELTAELDNTRKQLAEMLKELANPGQDEP
jgi:tetratricopeptide (TPR) repeat protein